MGNIDTDPLFKDTSCGDFHLRDPPRSLVRVLTVFLLKMSGVVRRYLIMCTTDLRNVIVSIRLNPVSFFRKVI